METAGNAFLSVLYSGTIIVVDADNIILVFDANLLHNQKKPFIQHLQQQLQ
jgi:hypothetical protein